MPPMGQPFTQDPLMAMMPQSYYVIYPEVNEAVNMMETQHGAGYTPTQAEFMGMANNVADRVQDKIYGMMDEGNANRVDHDESHDHGRRRLLFDLVAIILLSELFRRRR